MTSYACTMYLYAHTHTHIYIHTHTQCTYFLANITAGPSQALVGDSLYNGSFGGPRNPQGPASFPTLLSVQAS